MNQDYLLEEAEKVFEALHVALKNRIVTIKNSVIKYFKNIISYLII